jgi:uncharacterized protein YdhG (YjbR/CyaY superfamily)
VAQRSPERESYFPAIEKKYGQPMSYWFAQMKSVTDQKYPEQIAFLQQTHGFTREHANALVLYTRGSTTSRRFTSIDEFLAPLDDQKQKTVRAIFAAITRVHPDLELVIAWNQPMLKAGKDYVFGVSVATKHITIAAMGEDLIDEFRDRLVGYKVNKKTIQVPVDWQIDEALLRDITAARLAQISA